MRRASAAFSGPFECGLQHFVAPASAASAKGAGSVFQRHLTLIKIHMMKKQIDTLAGLVPYESPALDIVDVAVEQGFAGSIEAPQKQEDNEFYS